MSDKLEQIEDIIFELNVVDARDCRAISKKILKIIGTCESCKYLDTDDWCDEMEISFTNKLDKKIFYCQLYGQK